MPFTFALLAVGLGQGANADVVNFHRVPEGLSVIARGRLRRCVGTVRPRLTESAIVLDHLDHVIDNCFRANVHLQLRAKELVRRLQQDFDFRGVGQLLTWRNLIDLDMLHHLVNAVDGSETASCSRDRSCELDPLHQIDAEVDAMLQHLTRP